MGSISYLRLLISINTHVLDKFNDAKMYTFFNSMKPKDLKKAFSAQIIVKAERALDNCKF